jgi:solute carrier family 25 (peroxisomal adenine nucleotide transporter), member 17
MAKVRIQTRKKGREEAAEKGDDTLPRPAHASALDPKDEGAIDILARVLKTEGFLGWYKVGFPGLLLHPHRFSEIYVIPKGMGAQILKAVLSQGVLFMSKEQFEQYALAIMVFYYRLGRGMN